MTKFEKSIKAKEETLNRRMTKKNIQDANRIMDGFKEVDELVEKYRKLTKHLYGDSRKPFYHSIEDLKTKIAELEAAIANPVKGDGISMYDSQSKTAKR